jgi:hypothetical protein
MPIIGVTQFAERSQFFNGQRLFASDLDELEAFHREMRWLHNQSLHQPGLGSGYVPAGKKGDREVTISAGYALDAFGREIVLTLPHLEPIPPVADDGAGKPVLYDLTVSYPADADLAPSETRQGICLPNAPGVIRRREQPVFCWVCLARDANGSVQPVDRRLTEQVRTGLKITVARAEIFNCQLNKDLSVAERQNARPARMPYVACGRSKVTWAALAPGFGLTGTVPTAEAKFQVPPRYLVRLEDASPPEDNLGSAFSFLRALFVVSCSEVSSKQFVVTARLPFTNAAALFKKFSGATLPAGETFLEVARASWEVVWFGIEG